MKSRSLRALIVLTLLVCSGLIATQMFWVRHAYALEREAFEGRIWQALQEVSADLFKANGKAPLQGSAVELVDRSRYLIHLPSDPEEKSAMEYLTTALVRHNVTADFEYAGYRTGEKDHAFRASYNMPGAEDEGSATLSSWSGAVRNYPYLEVFFPFQKSGLQHQLNFWTASSIALLLAMAFLGYLLFEIFRQKRYGELQKDFVSNMTHEFQTPLATIQLAANVLKNPRITEQPRRLLNYATIIATESAGLTARVQRLLEADAADTSGLELNVQSFFWQDLIEDSVVVFEERHPEFSGVISTHFPLEPVAGEGDIAHLSNVLYNLLDNAVKYTARAPQVVVTLTADAHEVCIQVSDNGLGILPEHQKRLFQKFYRVPTGNVHDVKGFGLGLNYVWLLARAHRGKVRCSSQPGRGSIFTLTFPPVTKPTIAHERAQSKHPAG